MCNPIVSEFVKLSRNGKKKGNPKLWVLSEESDRTLEQDVTNDLKPVVGQGTDSGTRMCLPFSLTGRGIACGCTVACMTSSIIVCKENVEFRHCNASPDSGRKSRTHLT